MRQAEFNMLTCKPDGPSGPIETLKASPERALEIPTRLTLATPVLDIDINARTPDGNSWSVRIFRWTPERVTFMLELTFEETALYVYTGDSPVSQLSRRIPYTKEADTDAA